MKIAFVEHPITKEEKAKYRKEFDRVVDIRFAPEKLEDGSKLFPKKAAKKATKKAATKEIVEDAE